MHMCRSTTRRWRPIRKVWNMILTMLSSRKASNAASLLFRGELLWVICSVFVQTLRKGDHFRFASGNASKEEVKERQERSMADPEIQG